MLKNSGSLPEKPGVYIFKSAAGKALYIGKAANLKKRVAQYFQKKGDPLLQRLLEQAGSLETIVTEAESDALLLESNLVHSYLPPFNVRLKDDKSFPFIEITLTDDAPGIFYSRRVAAGSFALGPLVPGCCRELNSDLLEDYHYPSCIIAIPVLPPALISRLCYQPNSSDIPVPP